MQELKRDLPLVSIICNTYNHASFIRDALEGFLMQTCSFPFEILIHDDASTDSTADIIREYEKQYPDILKPIYQTENQWSKKGNTVTALQRSRALGKYIALCEGDDYWTDPLKLQKQVDFLENHPEYALCFHKSAILNLTKDTWKSRIFQHLKQKEYSGDEILLTWSVPTASIMYRSLLVEKINAIPKTEGILYFDIVILLTIAEHGKLYCLGDTMSVYRVHPQSLLHKNDKNRGKNYSIHLQTMKTLFGGKYKRIINLIIADRYITVVKDAWKNKQYQAIPSLLFKATILDPFVLPKRGLQYFKNLNYTEK